MAWNSLRDAAQMRCQARVTDASPLCSCVTISRARTLKSSSASKRFLAALHEG